MGEKRNNSAGRVHDIFSSTWSQSDKIKIIDAWSKVLGLEDIDKTTASFRVTESLSLIRGELEHIGSEMAELNIAADLYEPYLQRCRIAMNISNLQNNWAGPKAQIREDTLLSLKLCAELTADEAVDLTVKELEDTLQDVQNLRENLANSGLPAKILTRIYKHLGLISETIHQAPIFGAHALRDGFRKGVSELLDDESELLNDGETSEVREVLSIWSKVRKAGGTVIELDRITSATMSMFEKAGEGWRRLEKAGEGWRRLQNAHGRWVS